MIHGLGAGVPKGLTPRQPGDWTNGCIAVADVDVKERWKAVPNGTSVEILP